MKSGLFIIKISALPNHMTTQLASFVAVSDSSKFRARAAFVPQSYGKYLNSTAHLSVIYPWISGYYAFPLLP